MPAVKAVGKPYDRKGHVRFDEGALETEYGTSSEALPTERGSNGWDVPTPPRQRPTLLIALFALETDAQGFATALPERLAKFGLTLAGEKTKLIPFGRRHWTPGQSYSHHFDLLGFRHHLGTTRYGRMTVVRIPCPKSVRKFLSGVKTWLQAHLHDRPTEQQQVLAQKLRGFYQYFALWHTLAKLGSVYREVRRLWLWALRRRSQRGRLTWQAWERKAWFALPQPRLLHRTV